MFLPLRHGDAEKGFVYAATTLSIEQLFVCAIDFERFYPGVKWLYRGLSLPKPPCGVVTERADQQMLQMFKNGINGQKRHKRPNAF